MPKSFIFSYPFNGDIQGILDILQSPRIQEIYAPLESPFLGTPRVTRYTPSKDYILKLKQILDKSKKNLNILIDSLSGPKNITLKNGLNCWLKEKARIWTDNVEITEICVSTSKNKDLNFLRTAQTNGEIK